MSEESNENEEYFLFPKSIKYVIGMMIKMIRSLYFGQSKNKSKKMNT